MVSRAVDLPDPLEGPISADAGGDDLLEELAGQEIERLLAEARATAAEAQAPNSVAPLQFSDPIDTPTESPHPQPDPASEPSNAAPVPAASDPRNWTLEQELDAQEQDSLRTFDWDAKESTAPSRRAHSAPLAWLSVLEWLSAPMEACSPQTRQLIGKLAILIAVDAIALLIYLFCFGAH